MMVTKEEASLGQDTVETKLLAICEELLVAWPNTKDVDSMTTFDLDNIAGLITQIEKVLKPSEEEHDG